MKISCVMSVYNTKENYLRAAIESVLNQTFTDFELIIVDDGSTDSHVKKTILSYKDKRIKYLYQKNKGIAHARNFGNSMAKGEYIAVLDSDDIACPERFEKEVKFLDEHPDFFCVGSSLKLFPEEGIWTYPEYPCLLDCLNDSPIGHSSAMYRKSDLKKNDLQYGTDYAITQDFYLWAQALIKGLKFYNFADYLCLYRRENQGITTTKKEKIEKEILGVKESVINFLVGNNQNLRKKLNHFFDTPKTLNKKVHFLGISLLKIKQKNYTTRYYLFGFLPILKIKEVK